MTFGEQGPHLRPCIKELGQQSALNLCTAVRENSFEDVAGIAVPDTPRQFFYKSINDLLMLLCGTVFQDALDHVMSKAVTREASCIFEHLREEYPGALLSSRMLQKTAKDTTAEAVTRHLWSLSQELFRDETGL
mmetsp:Transcript_45609/g.99141  ORF Transcript_45609/g.99141 Transcript_45609/m.99141 type:complete len:134 (-) Transcript_45609:1128-1529(-)